MSPSVRRVCRQSRDSSATEQRRGGACARVCPLSKEGRAAPSLDGRTIAPLTHSPTHPLTHSPTHSPTHPLTHSPTHPLTHCCFLVCGVCVCVTPACPLRHRRSPARSFLLRRASKRQSLSQMWGPQTTDGIMCDSSAPSSARKSFPKPLLHVVQWSFLGWH